MWRRSRKCSTAPASPGLGEGADRAESLQSDTYNDSLHPKRTRRDALRPPARSTHLSPGRSASKEIPLTPQTDDVRGSSEPPARPWRSRAGERAPATPDAAASDARGSERRSAPANNRPRRRPDISSPSPLSEKVGEGDESERSWRLDSTDVQVTVPLATTTTRECEGGKKGEIEMSNPNVNWESFPPFFESKLQTWSSPRPPTSSFSIYLCRCIYILTVYASISICAPL